MPKENKKRGRRGGKRKIDEVDNAFQDASPESTKRRKSIDAVDQQASFIPLNASDENLDGAYPPAVERQFFGMLDEEEQEYFKRADDMLEANAFGDSRERELFLANVYKEAEGKVLKIASSQSCSRLMERLIRLSNSSQLKSLFQNFSGK